MEPADVVLLERWVGRRDAEAFQAIVRRYSALVFSACRRMLGDAARAEDVTQECFLKLAMGDARPGPFLGPWLHRMATRRCLDTLRSEQRRRARERKYVAEGPQSVELRWEKLEPLIDEALAALPERYRVPITVHFLEGLSHEEVAQRLGMPRRTVSYRIAQGLERLGTWLRARGVNVASGVLIAQMGEMPVLSPPVELAAKLSKMALARTARVHPQAHWSSGSLAAYGIGAIAAVLVAAMGLVGVNRLHATPDEVPVVVAATPVVTETPTAVEPDARLGSQAAPVVERASAVEPVVNAGPSGSSDAALAAPAKEEPKPCTVSGIVVDEARQPIPNATVRLLLEGNSQLINASTRVLSTETDESGLFRITGIPPRQPNMLQVGAAGFHNRSVQSFLLEPGRSVEDQCIILLKGLTLRGKVLGCDGLPVSNALVVQGSYYSDSSSGGGSEVVLTDEKGLFQMGYPGESKAVVRIVTKQWGDAIFEVDVQADTVVELRMPESARLEGRVMHADGSPANELRVVVCPVSGEGVSIARYEGLTIVDGLYEIPSLPPDLSYEATVMDVKSKVFSGKQTLGVLAAGSTTKRDFQLAAPAHVRGTVLGVQTGRPQKNARVGWILDKESNDSAASTGDDGTYELEFFTPGTYWIHPVPAPNESEGDFVQKYGRSVQVRLGEDQKVDLTIPDAFSLAMRVVDGQGKPLANIPVGVVFSPDGESSSYFSHGETDDSGRFRFEGFRPGFESWLVAHSPAQDIVARAAQIKNGGQAVETTHVAGESGVDYPEETVVLYGSSGLSGVALGPGGQPLANCRIDFGMSSPGVEIDGVLRGEIAAGGGMQTDASGAFTLFEGVPATLLSLSGTAQTEDGRAYRCEVGPLNCVPGQVMDLGRLAFEVKPATE